MDDKVPILVGKQHFTLIIERNGTQKIYSTELVHMNWWSDDAGIIVQ